jgi:hypothetical protein
VFIREEERLEYPLCPPCPPFGSRRSFAKGKSRSSYICRKEKNGMRTRLYRFETKKNQFKNNIYHKDLVHWYLII